MNVLAVHNWNGDFIKADSDKKNLNTYETLVLGS